MAAIPGCDQRAMGKTRIVTPRNNRELAAGSKDPELLFCSDPIPGAGCFSRENRARRAGALPAQLQSLPRFFEDDDDRRSTRCDRQDEGSGPDTARGLRKIFKEAGVAAGDIKQRQVV